MRIFLKLLIYFSLICLPCFANSVKVLTVDGNITPAVQDYIQDEIQKTDSSETAAVIIRLNTAGGLESAMRSVNETIILSKVPVITWVAPSGARALSAGVYLLYASHLAAMAQGTQMGDAMLTSLLLAKKNKQVNFAMYQKMVQDTTAYLKSLAQLRGRNADFAEIALTHSAKLSADSAYRQKVIDEIANDLPDLLQKMDGHNAVVMGIMEKIKIKNASIIEKPPGTRFTILNWISNPIAIYLLFLIAIYGIFYELATPGVIFPGLLGSIALVALLYGLQFLSINYEGLALLLIGSALLIAEFYVSSYFILAGFGLLAFLWGSWMLFDFSEPYYSSVRFSIMILSVLGLIAIVFLLRMVVRSAKARVITGAESMIGHVGKIHLQEDNRLTLLYQGDFWNILSDQTLQVGDWVEVVGVQGIHLVVVRVSTKEKTHD